MEGPGAFVMPVTVPEDFTATLVRKMTIEIAQKSPKILRVNQTAPVPCNIGETQIRDDYDKLIDDLTNGHPDTWRWRNPDWNK